MSWKAMPAGSVPDSVIVGAGEPVAVIVMTAFSPGSTRIREGLVNFGWRTTTGAELTVITNCCVAGLPAPFEAVTVMT